MDRATKLAVLCWTFAAIALQAWLTPGWRELPILAACAFGAAALLTAVRSGLVAVVLVLTYVFPALIRLELRTYHVSYDVVWMCALLGAITPQALRTPWHLPERFRPALVTWALIVAISATVVAGREVDFDVRLLTEARMPSEILNGVPGFTVGWILHVSVILTLGILWFDWLFGASVDVRRSVVAPLLASGAVMVAVAIYQLVVDVTFLNETVYGGLGRAAGTMFDANAMGVIAALWMGGLVVCAPATGFFRWLALGVGAPAAWLAVWASQSRTGFATAVMVTGFVLFDMSAGWSVRRPQSRKRLRLVLLSLLAIVLVTLFVSAGGPMGRFRSLVSSSGSPSALLSEFWNRNGYGRLAGRMIADHPLVGVGVGSFHLFVTDYAYLEGTPIPSDNAQNWYRHQLAEFGLIGSTAWILWVVAFTVFMFRRSRSAMQLPGIHILRGMLVAFGLISLVGMPGQVTSVAVTIWTVAFWFVSSGCELPQPGRIRSRTWTVIAVVCLVYAAGTLRLASTELRLPARAERLGLPYSYGLYDPEPDGHGGRQRWARRRAALLLDAPTRWLEVTISVNHTDIERRPVEAKVWLDGRLIVNTVLKSTQPVTRKVSIPTGRERTLLETWVSRVVRPRDYGVADDRELGLLLKWAFVNKSG